MIPHRKFYETIEQKIDGYESIIKFYEKNRDARFENKKVLENIFVDLDNELNKSQTQNNFVKLCFFQDKVSRLIC